MEKRAFVGTWWLPAAPENRVGGILTVEPSGKCDLQLTRSLLADPLWAGSIDDGELSDGELSKEASPIVHGKAGDEEFTVLHPAVIEGGNPLDDQPQRLKPHVVLRGIHLLYADQKVFARVELEVDNLTIWSSISGFKSTTNTKALTGESSDWWVRYELARPAAESEKKGVLGGFDVELKWTSTFNPEAAATHAGRQVKASELVKARIQSQEPAAWDQFINVSKSFQDLLTFATRHPCAIRSCNLIVSAEGGDLGRVELIRTAFVEPKADKEAKWNTFLFHARDVSFPELLGKWDKLQSDVGMGIHVLFSLDYERGGYLENRIMNAASAAESIHRALHPNVTGLPVEEHKAALAAIKKAVKGFEHGSWFLGRLRNDPGFKDRMHQLAAIPSAEAVTSLLADTGQWATWLKDARNAVAHLERTDLEKIPAEARYQISEVTIALLHLVFLAEIGLSSEIQMRAVNVVYGGATENFRNAVKAKIARRPS